MAVLQFALFNGAERGQKISLALALFWL